MVTNCWECHYSKNSSQYHNDPFTSAPYPTVWFCEAGNNSRVLCGNIMEKIDKDCIMIGTVCFPEKLN